MYAAWLIRFTSHSDIRTVDNEITQFDHKPIPICKRSLQSYPTFLFNSYVSNQVTCNWLRCDSVGRAVASNTRGPRFESSHRQRLLNQYFLLTVCLVLSVVSKRGIKWPNYKTNGNLDKTTFQQDVHTLIIVN